MLRICFCVLSILATLVMLQCAIKGDCLGLKMLKYLNCNFQWIFIFEYYFET